MGAIEKTAALRRVNLKVSQLVKRGDNPNKMGKRAFDLLVDNLEQTGLTDPILVRPLIGEFDADGLPMHRIVGGHHRYDGATYLGFEDVPCTVLPDDFDEDAETFQVLRMNQIRGKLDPQSFIVLYQKMAEKYSDSILQEAFGFDEAKEFQRLVALTVKSIEDPVMQAKFKEAAKTAKTIDGLAAILNQLFNDHGDTLPYGFMIFDYGGRKSVWLRIEAKTLKAVNRIGARCLEERRTVDDVLGKLVQLIADGKLDDQLAAILASTPEVEIPAGMPVIPTLDNLAGVTGKAKLGDHL